MSRKDSEAAYTIKPQEISVEVSKYLVQGDNHTLVHKIGIARTLEAFLNMANAAARANTPEITKLKASRELSPEGELLRTTFNTFLTQYITKLDPTKTLLVLLRDIGFPINQILYEVTRMKVDLAAQIAFNNSAIQLGMIDPHTILIWNPGKAPTPGPQSSSAEKQNYSVTLEDPTSTEAVQRNINFLLKLRGDFIDKEFKKNNAARVVASLMYGYTSSFEKRFVAPPLKFLSYVDEDAARVWQEYFDSLSAKSGQERRIGALLQLLFEILKDHDMIAHEIRAQFGQTMSEEEKTRFDEVARSIDRDWTIFNDRFSDAS